MASACWADTGLCCFAGLGSSNVVTCSGALGAGSGVVGAVVGAGVAGAGEGGAVSAGNDNACCADWLQDVQSLQEMPDAQRRVRAGCRAQQSEASGQVWARLRDHVLQVRAAHGQHLQHCAVHGCWQALQAL